MDLNLTVIILNDLIMAIAFFCIGFFVSEMNKAQLFKRKQKPTRNATKIEDNHIKYVDKSDIMDKIRKARGQ